MGVSEKGLVSAARLERRSNIANAARSLLGVESGPGFDPVHAPLCPVDVVMVAGAPWLKDGLERDFAKDESGYKKIGGGANTPQMAYFFRSATNLTHYLKRQGFYTPRGADPKAAVGMACFLDWDDRGRFNFAPDRSGIISGMEHGEITKIILATCKVTDSLKDGYVVKELEVSKGSPIDQSLIGYSDLP